MNRASAWPSDRARHPAQRGGLADSGVSILLVEQNARAALEIADYGYVLETGEVCSMARPHPCSAIRGCRPAISAGALTAMANRIAGYEGVAWRCRHVPYERFSIRGAHWFMARALKALVDGAGISKDDIDGLCVASFTLAPDSAVGLTQHLGLSPRWLDHIRWRASAIVSCAAPRAPCRRAMPRSSPASPPTPTRSTVFARAPQASACSHRTRSILTALAGQWQLCLPHRLLYAHLWRET